MKIVFSNTPHYAEIEDLCTRINALGYLWIIRGNDPVEVEVISLKGKKVELKNSLELRALLVLHDIELKP